MIEKGLSAEEIKERLTEDASNYGVYIMLDTLYYLKKGGRITPSAAAIGTMLKLKPVLTIQNGGKLDAFAKARTATRGKNIMVNAIKNDAETRLGGFKEEPGHWLAIAYTGNNEGALAFKSELEELFPGYDIHMDPLSLSVACHIGPGALAFAVMKKIEV